MHAQILYQHKEILVLFDINSVNKTKFNYKIKKNYINNIMPGSNVKGNCQIHCRVTQIQILIVTDSHLKL